ncbi:hypothetical protein [Meiothermus sp. CFH 77666]|uniref:hypothetical protein n=1 Tax=Meiothermus sp. CFH 77666 TaxID=2817942 RepID=UPI001AA0A35F|nr:hypothetical protein [Meiothermus sp. CFH 77666]MBO1437996.1 hypothetical protein [Meiothermus sp. CFH 77666]
MRLTENHRRVLSLALAELEEYLLRLERALTEEPLVGHLYQEANALQSHERAESIVKVADALRGQVGELARLLALEPVRHDRFDLIWAGLSAHWANLEELRPAHLSSYGPLKPEVAGFLEVRLSLLERGLERIENILTEVEDVQANRGGV